MLWSAVYSSSYLGFILRPVVMNIQNKDLYLLQSMIYHEQFANFDGICYFSVPLSSWKIKKLRWSLLGNPLIVLLKLLHGSEKNRNSEPEY